jgi:hypothetical protein
MRSSSLNLLASAALLVLLVGCTGQMQGYAGGADAPGVTPDPETPTGPSYAPFVPGASQLRRLTQQEWRYSLVDVLGEPLRLPDAASLEPDAARNGFSAIGSSAATLSGRGVEQFETASLDIAAQIMRDPARRAAWVPCAPAGAADVVCAREGVERLGRRLWRRALTEEEAAQWAGLAAQTGEELGDFWVGMEFAMAGLLQSPAFLYRSEYGEGAGDKRRLSGVELASRLSYLLWSSAPDEALLAAAEAGELEDTQGLEAQVERLLGDERARRALDVFWLEYLELGGLGSIAKDPETYPLFTPTLVAAMREETLRLMRYLVFDGEADMREMFRTRTAFLNAELAGIYEVEGVPADGWVEREWPEDAQRRGIFGQAAFLATQSHIVHSSPTYRGKFIRQALLCQSIGAPPPNVNTNLPEPTTPEAQTLRQRLEAYFAAPTCGYCHAKMDPLGFALESFDALGMWREEDNGQAIDPSGEMDGAAFDDARGMAALVAEHPDAMRCMVRKTFRHALGHAEGVGEEIAIAGLHEQFEASGWRMKALLRALVTSDAFLYTSSAP